MPATVLGDSGEKILLNNALSGALWLRLFRNDVPVLPGSTLTDFDTPTWVGYADKDLAGLWPAALIDGVGRAYSQIPDVEWTVGSVPPGELVYGYILFQFPTPDSVFVGGQRYTAPVTIFAIGQTIKVSIISYLLRG